MLLITIRVRFDPDFPEVMFMTLRRHRLMETLAAEEVSTAARVDAALDIVRSWLEEFGRESQQILRSN